MLMIPVMYLTAVWQVARANQPPFTDPLTWTIVPLAVIIPFAVLIMATAGRKRRDVQSHKRLMLSAAIIIVMGPSIGRIPIAPPVLLGVTIQLLLGLLLFVPLFLWDRKTVGHTHPATSLGFAMAALRVAVPLAVFWFNLPGRQSPRICRRRRLGSSRFRHCRDELQRLVRRQRRAFLPRSADSSDARRRRRSVLRA